MTTTTPTKRPQHDAARAAYRQTVRLNDYVKHYVDKMFEWPAPVRKAEGKRGAA